ncbi:WLM-domain-containing protein [Trichoderma citrinoviride]|uniref:WLM-domain-containing protein n=1 Tax=Trichoderma citrinoviride TaxID=58853 RepID=A0A2T4B9T9_9HYPO|nr:WLM-domain-containing protein [Trichoderma citrinoviride]PTB65991.1 WLM-domain-containing protein [Trichoderma citrinoviride]
MPEHDPQVLSYSHLAQFRRAEEALTILKKVASLVKPIMRNRGWKVRELAEFYPNETNLLGLNVNRGMRICLRLRYPQDQNQFLATESIVDTMLHELCHIVHGPHDGRFHALWDQLRDEWQGLLFKGYTGEGFLSEGHRLGGRQALPLREVQRLARSAAEKRKAHEQLSRGSGRRLGGGDVSRPPRPGRNLRQAAAAAAEKRNKALQGCATDKLSDSEIRAIADSASRNGFRTQAEEDEANDLAIAQALWELAQEDEMANLGGGSYMNPSPAEKVMKGNGNTAVSFDGNPGSSSSSSSGTRGNTTGNQRAAPTTYQPDGERFWICSICTLHNPQDFLCCGACEVERSEAPLHAPVTPRQPGPRPAVIDLTSSPPRTKTNPRETRRTTAQRPAAASAPPQAKASGPAPAPPPTWRCEYCGTEMERQWWTCSTCGQMKFNSR